MFFLKEKKNIIACPSPEAAVMLKVEMKHFLVVAAVS
jgi:hypothetical protein